MARLGATVTGIDASEKNINIASLHSKKSGLKINYLNTSPENFEVADASTRELQKISRCVREPDGAPCEQTDEG